MSMEGRIRCLLGMLGTDVHNKGIRILAQMLRDAGVEVIYIGEHNTCEGMTDAIARQKPDLAGVSFSSSSYLDYMAELLGCMREKGVADIPLMIGGLIHEEDHAALRKLGVDAIFGPGSRSVDIIDYVQQAAKRESRAPSQ